MRQICKDLARNWEDEVKGGWAIASTTSCLLIKPSIARLRTPCVRPPARDESGFCGIYFFVQQTTKFPRTLAGSDCLPSYQAPTRPHWSNAPSQNLTLPPLIRCTAILLLTPGRTANRVGLFFDKALCNLGKSRSKDSHQPIWSHRRSGGKTARRQAARRWAIRSHPLGVKQNAASLPLYIKS